MMPEVLTPDICVIGAGSGGLTAAAAAAAFGVAVVLVEKGRMGGQHLNTGCVPSKALMAAARRAEGWGQAADFGLVLPRLKVDFEKVRDHIQRVITATAPNDSAERFGGLGVKVIKGTARFKDRRTVAVGEDIEVRARRFVIATGSSPAVPRIEGLANTPYLTNETAFDLVSCPKRLVVIGAGRRGLEMAQAFRRLGAEVIVVDAAQPLAQDDPECAAIVLNQLEREGISIRPGAAIVSVKPTKAKIQILLRTAKGEEKIDGSHLLLAAGRASNIDELNLAAAGIDHGSDGIAVDKGLKTSNKKVYAIGDVTGGLYFTHVATEHAGLVIRNALFRLPVRVKLNEIPRVTYTDPELAQVGMTEAEAKQRGVATRILRWPYLENDRAQAERATKGHIKVITNRKGKILGATIVGAEAGELITAWTLAISQGMNIRTVAGLVVPYPTLSEIGKRAAVSYFTPGLTGPWTQRILALLRLLG
jgi:pyruvate/2-oxoglutarate dehydrogenase complex dihydrolipoamide dehydrogenase (E3) component